MISPAEGVRKLRNAFILYAMAEIAFFVSFISAVNFALSFLAGVSSFTSIIYLVLSDILGLVLGIIGGIFAYQGFKSFPLIKGNADGGAIVSIVAFILSPLSLLVGLIIGIVGFALMKGGLDKISDYYSESTIRQGALLSLIPVVSIIGCIIIAVGLNKAENKPVAIQQPNPVFAQPTFYPSLVNQIGLGVIKSNGEIMLTLDSKISGNIISVRIENTPYFANVSIPINMGVNNVKINMNTVISLIPSTTYPITLIISNGMTSLTVNAQAIFNP